MEKLVETLATQFGLAGIVIALLVVAICGLWLAYVAERNQRTANLEKMLETLRITTEAQRETNATREAMVATLKELSASQQHVALRIERSISLLEAHLK